MCNLAVLRFNLARVHLCVRVCLSCYAMRIRVFNYPLHKNYHLPTRDNYPLDITLWFVYSRTQTTRKNQEGVWQHVEHVDEAMASWKGLLTLLEGKWSTSCCWIRETLCIYQLATERAFVTATFHRTWPFVLFSTLRSRGSASSPHTKHRINTALWPNTAKTDLHTMQLHGASCAHTSITPH